MAQEIHRVAWTVMESTKEGADSREFWTKIGRSFLNKDGSETVLLDALPVNGKLILRDKKAAAPATEGSATA